MNIGIDARLLERKITGIGRMLLMILKELPELDQKNKYFLFSYEPLKLNNSHYTNIHTVKSLLPQKLFSPFWNNLILPDYLKKNKIDIFFSINQIIPIRKVNGVKFISVVHDVICKADKSFLPFIYRNYLKVFNYFSIIKSDLIITVSEYSKQDILKYYKIDHQKIKVIHLAADKHFCFMNMDDEEKRKIRNELKLPENIVLYVGMIENRKNITGILKISDEIKKINPGIKFIIIGNVGHGGKKLLKEISKRDNIIHLKNVGDQLLIKIYNVASVLLFPSFYEGFGFPPLEAMQSGLPVLAANNTSLKEIIGDGGILHEPQDYYSFVNDILKLLSDKKMYSDVREKGLKRAVSFNIKNTVGAIVEVFNDLA